MALMREHAGCVLVRHLPTNGRTGKLTSTIVEVLFPFERCMRAVAASGKYRFTRRGAVTGRLEAAICFTSPCTS